jgi:site-specific DNA recombinase
LAVKRVDIGIDAVSVRMRIDGLAELAQELLQSPEDKDAAA